MNHLDELTRLAAGLEVISESEAPLDIHHLPAAPAAATAAAPLLADFGPPQAVEPWSQLLDRQGADTDSPNPALQASAQRFVALRDWMATNLTHHAYLQAGEVQVRAIVLGQLPDGSWLAAATLLIQT